MRKGVFSLYTAKRKIIIASTYVTALILIMGTFLLRNSMEARYYKRQAAINYSHAFAELATCMEEMSVSLDKALYAASPSMISSVCTEAYANSQAARQALGVLPYGNIELEHTAAFISKTGDYLRFLSDNAARGGVYSDDDREHLRSLSESAAGLSQKLQELESGVIAGTYDFSTMEQSEEQLGSTEDDLTGSEGEVTDGDIGSSFKQMETEFPEIPTLIYDGPFSEHIASRTPKLTEGKQELSEDDILYVAADFTGLNRSAFSIEYTRETDVPVYVLSASTKSGDVSLEITRTGGFVAYYGYNRPVMYTQYSPEECVKAAEAFLRQRGITSMRETYWTVQDNAVLVSFAYEQNGVTCYPDLIKVSVAPDTREIVGFESLGYIMNHTARELTEAKITAEDAKSRISPELLVKSSGLAVIPTGGKNEVYCYEFLCEDNDGRHVLVYVNADTGTEESILILIEDENGTLTV